MKDLNLKWELINGRYIIGYFDDTGWHFYKEVASGEEAEAVCQKKKSKTRKGRAK